MTMLNEITEWEPMKQEFKSMILSLARDYIEETKEAEAEAEVWADALAGEMAKNRHGLSQALIKDEKRIAEIYERNLEFLASQMNARVLQLKYLKTESAFEILEKALAFSVRILLKGLVFI